MDRDGFRRLVIQATNHLYDTPYLQRHPLGDLLIDTTSHDNRGRLLQQMLLDAIHSLKPRAELDVRSPQWRTYRYLYLRCVQVVSPRELADELGVGERQARRVYREAIDALASVLWNRCTERRLHLGRDSAVESGDALPALEEVGCVRSVPDFGRGIKIGGVGTTPASSEVGKSAAVIDEVGRLAVSAHGSSTDLADALDSLGPLIETLAARHGCALSMSVRPGLCVSADRVILRQCLINLCEWCFNRGPGLLGVDTCDEQGRVSIVLTFRSEGVPRLHPLPAPVPPGSGLASFSIEQVGRTDIREPAPSPHDWRVMVSRQLVAPIGGIVRVTAADDGDVTIIVSFRGSEQPKVLTIDDNPDFLLLLRRYLESAGCAVVEATNGAVATRLAQEVRPSAIILDVMMAGQDGWETLQLLKNHPRTHTIPVLVCSVLRDHELAGILGATALVPKPLTRADLYGALTRCGVPIMVG